MDLIVELPDAEATARAGSAMAPLLRGGTIVTLQGELGAGKTTLVRGVLRALGWTGPVKSPSYGLVEHYPLSSLYFYHIDFYRFASPSEWENAGLAECFRHDSVCMIEWPERVAGLLPAPDVVLVLAHSNNGRRLRAMAHGEVGRQCLCALAATFPDR